MSNSSLVSYTKISPNRTSPRQGIIKNIVIHHMAGNLTVETCGNVFAPSSRQASSNYGIGSDGRIGMYCPEADRAWTTGNKIDHSSVTIEVADNTNAAPWGCTDKAMAALINLCVDICKRNGISKLNYTGDKSGNLLMHKWYQSTDCPGAYLEGKFSYIASEVNKQLDGAQGTSSAVNTTATATSTASASGKLTIDGSWGQATTKRTQEVLGTTADGTVSNQPTGNKKYLPNASTTSWQFKSSGYSAGSAMIRALQKLIGTTVDGYFGQKSVKALQKFLGVTQDGIMGPATVKAWQTWLNKH